MEELSIEEKAQRYDEALEKSKRLYEQGTITENLAYIFPELKESEDERIRKALIEMVKMVDKNPIHQIFGYGDIKYSDMIAWLEKQGKQKLGEVRTTGYWHVEDIEQKLADKPKFKVKYAGSEYNVFKIKDIAGVTFYEIEDEPNHIDYVKADNCEIISVYGIKESGL